ncbi:MAG: TatD family hydrolase [Muribaculaceae bacterium]|nr:TatD family hydrolase [Muribaculaceae bacterium]
MIPPGVTDIHTHNPHAPTGTAIVNIEPDAGIPADAPPGALYSTGVHPWRSAEAATLWPRVENLAGDDRIAAIGEAGLDRLKGAPLSEQLTLLERHARLADALGKPLIVHCVRAWAELLALHRRLRPAQPWIIHGFRGAPALAARLLEAGMYISLGPRFNPATAAAVPAHRLLLETDDNSAVSIADVAAAVAAARDSSPAKSN